MKRFRTIFMASVVVFCIGATAESAFASRQIINLNGSWNIAEGTLSQVPGVYPHRVPVPGLVDMSSPDFFEVGIPSERRECFWYQKTFRISGTVPEVALLKIHKAKYGAKVVLNGSDLGEHLPCFTPGYFDVKPFVKGGGEENELIVRVGAHLESIPKSMPNGWDFEKYKYLPGIYDDVELILSGVPFIENIQIAPDISASSILVQMELKTMNQPYAGPANYIIREKASGRIVAQGQIDSLALKPNSLEIVKVPIPVPDAHLWSPEDPFLYTLELQIGADAKTVAFGMRSFDFDAKTGRAMLNGKPYYMRGTNVCIYRFFEDNERNGLPWDRDWVRRFHETCKAMNWNSMRYCIGFPPELWYEIADEVGMLIQDEFPIWSLNEWPEELKSGAIAPEYVEWMRERWNHPCVVVWDAQNESITDETGVALQMVRHLDLSNRPWDNGWGLPQAPNDTLESHPYYFSRDLFQKKAFLMSELANESGKPRVQKRQESYNQPIILNEYAWLWLNRDGSSTIYTEPAFLNQLGGSSTTEQRRELYARYLAAFTEFWRAHRECAAVMHFCGLGYSRPGGIDRPAAGVTSDNFIDVENLIFEPFFENYVKDAFAPVGLMIDVWDDHFSSGQKLNIPVYVINDLYGDWKGIVRLRIQSGDAILSEQTKTLAVQSLGREIVAFEQALPKQKGTYFLIAEITDGIEPPTRSYRKFMIE